MSGLYFELGLLAVMIMLGAVIINELGEKYE